MTTFTFLVGCLAGSAIVSWMADYIGRKVSLLIGGIIFLVGGILQTAAPTVIEFYFGRTISGVAIGILSVVCPLYISEASPPDIRGKMVTIQQLMITIGIFVASVINSIIIVTMEETNPAAEWRVALGLQCMPAVALFFIMLFMPKSPRWLAKVGRNDEALKAIAKLVSCKTDHPFVVQEHREILESVQAEKQISEGPWSELFSKEIISRFFIVVVMQAFQQWTGINVIMYYQGVLFDGMGIDRKTAAIPFTLANNFINMVATLPGMYLVDRLGRRKLLIVGAMGMSLSHFLICMFGNLVKVNQGASWGAVLSIYLFLICFASTWGPIAWIYQSEVFPLRIRAKGTSAGTMSNWLWNAIISLITLFMFEKISFYSYLVFGFFGIAMTLFVIYYVPETSGVPLEEMEGLFRKRVRLTQHIELEDSDQNVNRSV